MGISREKILLRVLILVVIVLLLFVGYAFVLQPAITGYVVNSQNQGFEYAILTIAQKAANCEQVPLFIGNQTINLIAVECLQQGTSVVE